MDKTRLTARQIVQLLDNGKWQEASTALEAYQPVDIAFMLKDLSQARQLQLISLLEPEEGAEALAHLDPNLQANLITVLPREKAIELLGDMSPDDVADLVGELPHLMRDQIMELLEQKAEGNVR